MRTQQPGRSAPPAAAVPPPPMAQRKCRASSAALGPEAAEPEEEPGRSGCSTRSASPSTSIWNSSKQLGPTVTSSVYTPAPSLRMGSGSDHSDHDPTTWYGRAVDGCARSGSSPPPAGQKAIGMCSSTGGSPRNATLSCNCEAIVPKEMTCAIVPPMLLPEMPWKELAPWYGSTSVPNTAGSSPMKASMCGDNWQRCTAGAE
mmetsp:Transcript_85523/g.246872  ORF Transcript_85523/g.246872 Transcript_85523/m.246872 type:complete len:202 (-) Transcript_85523:1375-1980(-)